jgi:hypothetical protein
MEAVAERGPTLSLAAVHARVSVGPGDAAGASSCAADGSCKVLVGTRGTLG